MRPWILDLVVGLAALLSAVLVRLSIVPELEQLGRPEVLALFGMGALARVVTEAKRWWAYVDLVVGLGAMAWLALVSLRPELAELVHAGTAAGYLATLWARYTRAPGDASDPDAITKPIELEQAPDGSDVWSAAPTPKPLTIHPPQE